jgi:hypothetical protein
MRLIELAGFYDDLRPLSPAQLARRKQIKAVMDRAREAASEGIAAASECVVACVIAAPVAVGIVLYRMGI